MPACSLGRLFYAGAIVTLIITSFIVKITPFCCNVNSYDKNNSSSVTSTPSSSFDGTHISRPVLPPPERSPWHSCVRSISASRYHCRRHRTLRTVPAIFRGALPVFSALTPYGIPAGSGRSPRARLSSAPVCPPDAHGTYRNNSMSFLPVR